MMNVPLIFRCRNISNSKSRRENKIKKNTMPINELQNTILLFGVYNSLSVPGKKIFSTTCSHPQSQARIRHDRSFETFQISRKLQHLRDILELRLLALFCENLSPNKTRMGS
ncbi:hypothetical protein CEXT_453541 [Caerostris extrusa]|uniref:Uncharacterized protein n=1 Tax=Caerostris extrusa TaxID=172846 RepID=A0AAV4NC93_CAEEX|nr:hypothetical protein CEXT_453541 [Caerostris extrusa]